MVDLLLQFVVLLVLLGLTAWGYLRWVRPHQAQLDFQAKGLMALIVLTFAGGFLGSFFWWWDEPRSFSWDLPPLASRMLASAGWSFAVATFLALERPTTRRMRLVLVLLATYLLPLVGVALLFHLNRFDFAAPITYGFFIIAGGMSIAAVWYLLQQPVILPDAPEDAAPPAPVVKGWLSFLAILTGLWGLALFATDNGPAPQVWVWPGDLLTSRLIGVMLLTIAVGSAWSLRYGDLSRLMLAMTIMYGLDLALASLWNMFSGKPVKLSYLIVFGLIALVSTFLLVRQRAVMPRAALNAS